MKVLVRRTKESLKLLLLKVEELFVEELFIIYNKKM